MKQLAKLSQKLPVVSGESSRGPWKKQSAIFKYPNSDTKFMVDFFGDDRVAQLDRCAEGDLVEVDFLLTCHEAEAAVFHDVRGLSIVKLTKDARGGASVAPSTASMSTDPNNPFDK